MCVCVQDITCTHCHHIGHTYSPRLLRLLKQVQQCVCVVCVCVCKLAGAQPVIRRVKLIRIWVSSLCSGSVGISHSDMDSGAAACLFGC